VAWAGGGGGARNAAQVDADVRCGCNDCHSAGLSHCCHAPLRARATACAKLVTWRPRRPPPRTHRSALLACPRAASVWAVSQHTGLDSRATSLLLSRGVQKSFGRGFAKRWSAVSDGGEDQGAEEALWGRRRKNHHVSFGKSRLARAALPFLAGSRLRPHPSAFPVSEEGTLRTLSADARVYSCRTMHPSCPQLAVRCTHDEAPMRERPPG